MRLRVRADDLAVSHSITDGILECVDKGLVTGPSIIERQGIRLVSATCASSASSTIFRTASLSSSARASPSVTPWGQPLFKLLARPLRRRYSRGHGDASS